MTLPLNILVIDGCASTRALVATLVRMGGHSVALAETADAGLRLLDSQRPDLILAEARLPDLGGGEFVRRLRAHPGADGALIFTMSAGAPEACGGLCEAGSNGLLAKPLCRTSLIHLVDAVAWSRSSAAAMAEAARPARTAA